MSYYFRLPHDIFSPTFSPSPFSCHLVYFFFLSFPIRPLLPSRADVSRDQSPPSSCSWSARCLSRNLSPQTPPPQPSSSPLFLYPLSCHFSSFPSLFSLFSSFCLSFSSSSSIFLISSLFCHSPPPPRLLLSSFSSADAKQMRNGKNSQFVSSFLVVFYVSFCKAFPDFFRINVSLCHSFSLCLFLSI